jgi:RNase P protein component
MSVLGQMITAPSDFASEQPTPTKSGITIKSGEEAVLDADGRVISKNAMSRERFSQLIQETMEGQNLLPESHMIGVVYQQLYGLPNQELLSILGSDWLIAARRPYPRLRGTNNLVIPENKLPKEEVVQTTPEAIVLTYVCKAYGNQPAYSYYTGQGSLHGGSLANAKRFTTTSKSSATCSGKKAGSTGNDPTSPNFL